MFSPRAPGGLSEEQSKHQHKANSSPKLSTLRNWASDGRNVGDRQHLPKNRAANGHWGQVQKADGCLVSQSQR